ncbi:hypothetical protein [Borreliella lusitaniae]|uniref:hypothetical protein n=1 Tax=Borreliella lusitaniae TaxID=100177 RepID=UPI003C779D9F
MNGPSNIAAIIKKYIIMFPILIFFSSRFSPISILAISSLLTESILKFKISILFGSYF